METSTQIIEEVKELADKLLEAEKLDIELWTMMQF